jgi:hypothetical protein
LLGGDEVRQRVHHRLVDSAFQVASTAFLAGTLLQQVVLGRFGEREDERNAGRRMEDPFLQDPEFDHQDVTQFGRAQHPEYACLIDAIHELGRKLAAGRVQPRPVDLAGQSVVKPSFCAAALGVRGGESQVWPEDGAHFGCSEVAGHEDYGSRELYAPVIAQGKSDLIQDSEQQVPKGIASSPWWNPRNFGGRCSTHDAGSRLRSAE